MKCKVKRILMYQVRWMSRKSHSRGPWNNRGKHLWFVWIFKFYEKAFLVTCLTTETKHQGGLRKLVGGRVSSHFAQTSWQKCHVGWSMGSWETEAWMLVFISFSTPSLTWDTSPRCSPQPQGALRRQMPLLPVGLMWRRFWGVLVFFFFFCDYMSFSGKKKIEKYLLAAGIQTLKQDDMGRNWYSV